MFNIPTASVNQYPVNEIVINGTPIGKVDDKTAEKIYNLVVGTMVTPKTKAKAKGYKEATEDYEVPIKAEGKVVVFTAYCKKAAYEVIKSRFIDGLHYTKSTGIEGFKSAKAAQEFVKANKVISKADMNAVIAKWNNK